MKNYVRKNTLTIIFISFIFVILLSSKWIIFGTEEYLEKYENNNPIKNEHVFHQKFLITDKVYDEEYIFYIAFERLFYLFLTGLLAGYLFSGYINKKHTTDSEKDDLYKKIFIIICITLLIIPVTRTDKQEKLYKERRLLTPYIPFFDSKTKKINYNYGKNFDDFLKDRFFTRFPLIKLNRTVKLIIPCRFINLDNKVLVDKKQNFLHEYVDQHIIEEILWKSLHDELLKFQHYCQLKNSKLYTVIIPGKLSVYPPDTVKYYDNSHFYEMFDFINKFDDINLLFPLKELLNAKESVPFPVFYKTDGHPTEDGAYILYISLMNKIKKDYPDINILSPEDFEYTYDKKVLKEFKRKLEFGTGCLVGGIPYYFCNKIHNFPNRIYVHKNKSDLKTEITNTDYIVKKVYFYPNGIDLRVLIFGDSNSENLLDFLPYSFKHVKQIRLNEVKALPSAEQFKIIKNYKKEITDFKPDIIIIYIGYAHRYQLFDINNIK